MRARRSPARSILARRDRFLAACRGVLERFSALRYAGELDDEAVDRPVDKLLRHGVDDGQHYSPDS